MNNIIFQIFGSASSRDYDVLVFVDKLGTIQENHETITKLDKEISLILTDKPINCNIGVLKNGMLKQVFKGYPLEVNNSSFYTYDLHKQYHPNQIKDTYELTRDIKHFKLKRCLRFILSFYSRIPEWRLEIKEAMRGDINKRINMVSKIDFTIHTEFPGKKETKEDIYKTFAFQLAQTHGLIYGNLEIYSKEDAYFYVPEFERMLKRESISAIDLLCLNKYLKLIVYYANYEIPHMKSLNKEILN